MESENKGPVHVGGCLARVFWMGLGNLVLVLAAVAIAQNQAGFALSAIDAVYWAVAVCLLAVRYADIQWLGGQTADNQPATSADWRRYAAVVMAASAAIWLGAHLIS